MRVEQLTVGPLEENCWLLIDPVSHDAVLVDPGDEADRLLAAVDAQGTTLREIWLTHAHFDHVGAVAAIRRAVDVPIRLHPLDLPLYRLATQSAVRFGLHVENPPEPTVALAAGDVLHLGAVEFTVYHVPGHAPGHVAFVGGGLCVSGDLLFEGSTGRTDLPGCDPAAMQRSLQDLASWPGALRVLTGHGPSTTVARELSHNPFLRGLARPVGA
ncbi:MAG: MBL fold metallo-hydrolase [Gemmatimonadaceae bacterium]|nr:MBL fold metallo-hydrolase [Gemmatimonadaceae bacterium]